MNREQLRALGLTEEQIDAVVADHARGIQAVQTRLTAAENRNSELEQQLESTNNSEELQQLTERAEQAESRVSELEGQVTQRTIDDLVNTALTEVGVTDLDYARYRLGEVELSEDGQTIVDLENKVKDLQTQIPNYFQANDNDEDNGKGTETGQNLDGFTRIGANAGQGQQSNQDDIQSMISAFTADLPAQQST